MSEITSILAKFQKGYEEKNPGNVSALISEIFLDRHDLLTLGTSTDEVCIGRDEVIKLIHDDWDGGWGDFKIDLDGAKIESDGDVAWFYSNCTVKYSFEDSDDEKNRSYVDFVKSVIRSCLVSRKEGKKRYNNAKKGDDNNARNVPERYNP